MRRKPYPDTTCAGCGKKATKFCDGWDGSSTKDTGHGSFSFRSQCGYPVCSTCEHLPGGNHQPRETKK